MFTDLRPEDRIDLTAIDAKTDKAGDQKFALVEALTGKPGKADLSYSSATGHTLLMLDVDGDGAADSVIEIDGDHLDFANFAL